METGASGTGRRGCGSGAFDGVDEADEDDVDLAVEVGDDVGEFAFAAVGSEVDRAFEGLVQQWGVSDGGAEDRGGGAGVGGELDPGAGVVDVGVVDELRGRR